LRPTKLGDVLGNESTKRALQSFIDKDSFPNVFLFIGPPGCGKTTLAQIVAEAVSGKDGSIHEVNGSVQNKVEDAREFADIATSCPFNGRPRVFILNEFHRFTDQAQDALKDPMEKTSARWLLTTDVPEKISLAIRSRASAATFELKPLRRTEIETLVQRTGATSCGSDVVDFLCKQGITSPREILGVVEQYLAGVPLEETVHGAEHEPLYADIARSVLAGNWSKTTGFLGKVKTADSRAMTSVVSAFLGSALLQENIGPRADALATCVVGLSSNQFVDGIAYAATKGYLYKICKALSGASR
jgi:energy-coupling factor transporter ATP-binding protein EcfA2